MFGFLLADGNNYEKTYTVALELHPEDEYILYKFLEILGHNSSPKRRINNYGREYVRIKFHGKKISQDLSTLGVWPNKSYNKIFPPWLSMDNPLISHFIRGYFDGNGSIFTEKRRGNLVFSISSTKEMCEGLKNCLGSLPG